MALNNPNEKRTNSALWLGLLITVLGILSNFLYFLGFPPAIIPWLNVGIPAIGLIFLLVGVSRAFRQSQMYRGKAWGTIVTALAVLLFAGSLFGLFVARSLPRSAGAPQVGQRAPDFTLPNTVGQPVSLSQLLSPSQGGAPSKAVLLVFYRGYW